MRIAFLLVAFTALSTFAAEIQPLIHAHAHNDYEHPRPLLEALENGYCSVEADIHLLAGNLLVGHDPKDLKPERTLESLYLSPLKALAEQHRGRIYQGTSVILLVDIKTEAEKTYTALKEVLQKYKSILTEFEGNDIHTNAVTVILSGNRPRQTLLKESQRLAAYDGRLSDLGKDLPRSFMPLVSDNWQQHFHWKGEGEIPAEEQMRLRELTHKAHEEGRIIRFWGAPDNQGGWRILREGGVDLINTDHLPELSRFLRANFKD